MWSQSNEDCIREIDINSLSKGFGQCDVRCMCLVKGTVLVGTPAKEIFELKLSTGADVHSGPLMGSRCPTLFYWSALHSWR